MCFLWDRNRFCLHDAEERQSAGFQRCHLVIVLRALVNMSLRKMSVRKQSKNCGPVGEG